MQRGFQRRAPVVKSLDLQDVELDEAIRRVLGFPAVASKQFLITIGDRSITGLIGQEQMVGPWQVPVADVAVTLGGYRTYQGEAMAMGERSPLALIDAAASARMAVGEALTNLVAADLEALDRTVLSANWMAASGDEAEEQALFDAVRAVGMELCPALGIAIPVGKDSLSMRTQWRDEDGESVREVVAPMTLIVSAFAPVADARRTLTPQLRPALGEPSTGSGTGPARLLLVDLGGGRNRLGGSALAQCFGKPGGECPDVDDAEALARALDATLALNREGRILAYHDRSDGGLLAALAEMAFAGRLGWDVDIEDDDLLAALFNEELGFVLQVAVSEVPGVVERYHRIRVVDLGAVRSDQRLRIRHRGALAVDSEGADWQRRWAEPSFRMQRLRDNPAVADEEYAVIGDHGDPGLCSALTFEPGEDPARAFSIVNARPRVAVLREQGVNGQLEMAAAFDRAGFTSVDVHMSDLLSGAANLLDFPVFAACGGFSYGDVLGGGGGWAKSVLFHERVRDAFEAFFQADRLALGICNGCQMMANLKATDPRSGKLAEIREKPFRPVRGAHRARPYQPGGLALAGRHGGQRHSGAGGAWGRAGGVPRSGGTRGIGGARTTLRPVRDHSARSRPRLSRQPERFGRWSGGRHGGGGPGAGVDAPSGTGVPGLPERLARCVLERGRPLVAPVQKRPKGRRLTADRPNGIREIRLTGKPDALSTG